MRDERTRSLLRPGIWVSDGYRFISDARCQPLLLLLVLVLDDVELEVVLDVDVLLLVLEVVVDTFNNF